MIVCTLTAMAQKSAPLFALSLLLATMAIASSVQAQYQWRDASGSMVFSDRPPPNGASVQIIKTPPAVSKAPAPSTAGTAPVGSTSSQVALAPATAKGPEAAASNPQKTAADRALAEKVKLAAQGDKAKEQAKLEQEAKDRVRQCEGLRENQRILDSGVPVGKLGKSGEREFMTDAERSTRAAETRKDLATHCK